MSELSPLGTLISYADPILCAMRKTRLRLRSILAAGLVFGLAPTAPAGFLDLFKDDLESIPASSELKRQEDAARADLNRALELEAQGREKKALDIHKNVVKKYPLTTAAAMSQFKKGQIYQKGGDYDDAFEAFQDFIDKYKGSSAFSEAIKAQYDIAQAGQGGTYKKKIFGVIPSKVQPSELLEWYDKIIANAPFSDFAPLAQFAIAEIYVELDKSAQAIQSYQMLVDKYPRHPKAPDAQFRIGEIGKRAIEKGNQDRSNIADAREAMEDVLVAYQDSGRAEEARAALTHFDLIEAQKFYEVGRFYEKQKKYRSAAIYYQKVLGAPSSEHYADAQARLDDVLAKAPAPDSGLQDLPPVGGEKKRWRVFGGKSEDIPADLFPADVAMQDLPPATEEKKGRWRLFKRKPKGAPADVPPVPTEIASVTEVTPSTAPASSRPPKVTPPPAPTRTVAAAPASSNPKLLKAKKGYVGPPAPDLKIASTKPKMRTNPAAVPLEKLDPAPETAGPTPPLPPEPDETPLPLPPPPPDSDL